MIGVFTWTNQHHFSVLIKYFLSIIFLYCFYLFKNLLLKLWNQDGFQSIKINCFNGRTCLCKKLFKFLFMVVQLWITETLQLECWAQDVDCFNICFITLIRVMLCHRNVPSEMDGSRKSVRRIVWDGLGRMELWCPFVWNNNFWQLPLPGLIEQTSA